MKEEQQADDDAKEGQHRAVESIQVHQSLSGRAGAIDRAVMRVAALPNGRRAGRGAQQQLIRLR
ncbi:hypothetical protein GCM10010151_25630 [Actinoallomurus spadix]|uniref:Uncharacterized protein n=1 Tax=Actinoallomurus spadix TaxID=79912 RepID=A0ABN0WEL4_9ACTN